jgi:mercuric ion transport protein
MPPLADRARRVLPSGLASLAGLACAACCVIPLLLAGGVLSGAGWAAVGAWIPGIAVALAALAGAAWWWRRRHSHHQASCAGEAGGAGGAGCACGGS